MGYEWEKFSRAYTDHYADLHRSVTAGTEHKVRLDEVRKSEEWGLVQNILGIAHIRPKYVNPFREVTREIAELKCSIDPATILDRVPFCECGFRISTAKGLQDLTRKVSDLQESAIREFDAFVFGNSDEIAEQLRSIEGANVTEFTTFISSGSSTKQLSNEQIDLLISAISLLEERGHFDSRPTTVGFATVFDPNAIASGDILEVA